MATRFLTSIDLEKHHINHIWPRFSLDVLETEKSNLDSINNALSPAEEAKKIREGNLNIKFTVARSRALFSLEASVCFADLSVLQIY